MTALTAETVSAIPAKASIAKPTVAKPTVAKTVTTSAVAKPGLLARLWTAIIESRMRQAERQIALHRHLLPGELQDRGERLAPRSEKDLPFGR